MRLVYRYREAKDYNIRAFKNNYINGSLYSKFENCGELNFNISPDILKKYNVSDEQRKHLIEVVIKNCKEKYYLASFTTNKPTLEREEWSKYAKNNGFCLIYDLDELYEAKRMAVINKKQIIEILDVHYTNTPYELAPFFMSAFKKINKMKIEDGNSEVINQIFDKVYNKKLGKYLVNSFAHKESKYRKYNEIRIVFQKINSVSNKPFINDILVLKPKGIIFGPGLNILSEKELIEISEQNNIPIIPMADNV